MADEDLLASRKRRMRRMLRDLEGAPGDAEADAVSRHLTSLPEVAAARCLALYAALPGEIATRPLFEACRRSARRCLLPRMGEGGALEFVAVDRWEDLRVGRYGVPEPGEGSVVPLSEAEVVVVPGQAFDASGRRLGRGGGHYDRALAGLERARCLVVGVAWSRRLVGEVPEGVLDQRVDAVVTEAGVIRAGES